MSAVKTANSEANQYHLLRQHFESQLARQNFALSLKHVFKLATGVLFAAHPIHNEAVSNITGRGELFM